MPKAVIGYDRDLPEIPGRLPWNEPDSFLVKDSNSPSGWRVDESGRRPSGLLLVPRIRLAVGAWRAKGYPGASDVTRRLFEYWFEEDHEVVGFPVPFRYWFCQREALETLAWLVEIVGQRDTQDLIRSYADIHKKDLLEDNIVFQTTMAGLRQIRRYVPELEADGIQDLPPENLRRYALKMATGSGKTWVMAMAVVWSYFHRQRTPGSDLSTNFLIIAPNIIVYQRLAKDFSSNRIFYDLPLVPPEWGRFAPKVILRGEATEPDASGNLFLTNIQQLYESRDQDLTPLNAVQAILGKAPATDLAGAGQRSMLERVKSLPHLVVMNDEAHHVHDDTLKWTQSLLSLHAALPQGLALWLDFSATPKDQQGMYYPWTVCDYPLAQAVEDRIVKAPIIVTKEDDPGLPKKDPEDITAGNVARKYGYWLHAAVARWKEHNQVYKKLGRKPVLFVMAEKNVFADKLAEYFRTNLGFKESEIQVIHTDSTGEVTKASLEDARELVRDIDQPDNKIKVIVSVMMLREGWDVRNVSIVLGLRPFTAQAEILPEQVIGRGLRLMTGVTPDRTQTLEVLGTRNLLQVLRDQLEAEGVGVAATRADPSKPIVVEPLLDRLPLDISIPISKPSLVHDFRRLSELDTTGLTPIFEQEDLSEVYRINLKMEFATTKTEVSQTDIAIGDELPGQAIASIAHRVVETARLPNRFSAMFPLVRDYVENRCFGRIVSLEDERVRSHLMRHEIQEGIAKYLARRIGELTLDRRTIEFERADFHLSQTLPFSWRRDLKPKPLTAAKTIFNYVATYNPYERRFAVFLDTKASDVLRFAALGTTEQGESGTQFRIDYLKPSGAIGFYHPDWVVVQKTKAGEVSWIIETKGRVWEGTTDKDEAMQGWCERVSAATGKPWRYARVDQIRFDASKATSLAALLEDESKRQASFE